MPARKRSPETPDDDHLQWSGSDNNNEHHEVPDESDGGHSSSDRNEDEFVVVKLAEVHKEVQCPICLGIIRKTRTVMECLHRFCRDCIHKSIRMGKKECPACRTHCASHRSLRDDPNYDALIGVLYPDIDKYEEEELAFHEEEKIHNEQIQTSFAKTFQRQSEALGRKRTAAKATTAAFLRRSPGSYQSARLRGRRNYQTTDLRGSDDNEDGNVDYGGTDSSSADELTEVTQKRCKRWGVARFSQPSSTAANAEAGGGENDSELNRESMGASGVTITSSERLSWGKAGIRSHTRYGSMSGNNGKNGRNSRLSKLVDHIQNLEENNELDMYIMLVSFDETRVPNLQRPYLCCRPNLSVKYLCQYVAFHTALQADEVEIYIVKELHSEYNPSTSTIPTFNFVPIDQCKDKLQVLGEEETLARIGATPNFSHGHLLLVYKKKSMELKGVMMSN